MAADRLEITINAAELVPMMAELSARVAAVGGRGEAERRIGRPIDKRLYRDMYRIELRGDTLIAAASPEFDRVLRALWD